MPVGKGGLGEEMGQYDKALVKAILGEGSWSLEDLMKAKAHVKAHFRRDATTGKLAYIKEHEKEFDPHVVYQQGDKVKLLHGEHAGKEMTVNGYSEEKHVLRLKHPDHPNVSISPHRVEHSEKTNENTPGEVKKPEPKNEEPDIKELKRVESGPYNFIHYSDGSVKISHKNNAQFLDNPSEGLMDEAKEALGLTEKPEEKSKKKPTAEDNMDLASMESHKLATKLYGMYHELSAKQAGQLAKEIKSAAEGGGDKASPFNKIKDEFGVTGQEAIKNGWVIASYKIGKDGKEHANGYHAANGSDYDIKTNLYDAVAQYFKNKKDKPAPKEETAEGWVQTGGQGGSNPGGQFKGPDGKSYYVKFYKNPDQGRSEVLANLVTDQLGLTAPKASMKKIEYKGQVKDSMATEWMGGLTLIKKFKYTITSLPADEQSQIAKHFLAAVLVGDRDVVGLVHDNLARTSDGKWLCVDRGGSFEFRAQGAHKDFGPNPIEFEGLTYPSINPEASMIFNPILKNTVEKNPGEYIKWLEGISEDTLEGLTKKAGLPASIAGAMRDRRDNIIKKIKAKYGDGGANDNLPFQGAWTPVKSLKELKNQMAAGKK